MRIKYTVSTCLPFRSFENQKHIYFFPWFGSSFALYWLQDHPLRMISKYLVIYVVWINIMSIICWPSVGNENAWKQKITANDTARNYAMASWSVVQCWISSKYTISEEARCIISQFECRKRTIRRIFFLLFFVFYFSHSSLCSSFATNRNHSLHKKTSFFRYQQIFRFSGLMRSSMLRKRRQNKYSFFRELITGISRFY